MDDFQKQLRLELQKQQRQLAEQEKILSASPEGFLFVRERQQKRTFYHQHKKRSGRSWQTVQTNITNNPAMLNKLVQKKIAEETRKICQHNVPLLQKINDQYISANPIDIIQQIPTKYDSVLKANQKQQLEKWLATPYRRCPYYHQYLNQETAYGEFVRSKSEVTIANALYALGIPFHYEEELLFANQGEQPYYPDFTILLPDFSFLYWEHWGLLSKKSYCYDNAEKLFAYQQNDLIIGKNLIITQDDKQGNCNSSIIYNTIETKILPYFQGICIDSEIIKGTI